MRDQILAELGCTCGCFSQFSSKSVFFADDHDRRGSFWKPKKVMQCSFLDHSGVRIACHRLAGHVLAHSAQTE